MSKMIGIVLLFYPDLGLALSECPQWRSSEAHIALIQVYLLRSHVIRSNYSIWLIRKNDREMPTASNQQYSQKGHFQK